MWLPWWLSGKEFTGQCRRHGSVPGQEDPLEKEVATHSSMEKSTDREACGLWYMASQKDWDMT